MENGGTPQKKACEEAGNEGPVNVGNLMRGGIFLYMDYIVINLVGYVYWLIISYIGSPEIVGSTTSAISLSLLLRTLVALEIYTGLKRFVGRCLGKKQVNSLRQYYGSSNNFSALLVSAMGVSVILSRTWISQLTAINETLVSLAGALIIIEGIGLVPRSLLVSTAKTNWLLGADLIANTMRLSLGVFLVFLGWGDIGAITGFLVAGLIDTVLLIMLSNRVLHSLGSSRQPWCWNCVQEVVTASFFSWMPNLVVLAGTRLGILIVYSFSGALETGIYYIIYALVNIVLSMPIAIFSLLFPVLSGLETGYKQATMKGIRFLIVLSSPLAIVLMTYPAFILNLISPEYLIGRPILVVLALSIVLSCFVKGVEALVYSKGMYHFMLSIGLTQSVTQVALYFLLVPLFSGLGAAVSFTSGYVTSFFVTLLITRKISFSIEWKTSLLYIAALGAAGLAVMLIGIPWLFGIPLIFALAVIISGRTRIMRYSDLQEIIPHILSRRIIDKVYPKLYPLLRILFPD
ncbi:MAG: oligosaccharide flippase family protein [Candidatus Ranarchaeia archaeon]